MKNILHSYRNIWKDKSIFLSVVYGLLLLIVSLVVNYFAGLYATAEASNSVTDIILNNVPVVHVDEIFVEGFLLLLLFISIVLLCQPERMPFALKSIALFVVIRSIFVILTHIAPFPYQSKIDINFIYSKVSFTGDLFFSGHTGLPFLLALIFWDRLWLKLTFISLSVVFAVTVLLGHIHYSIDVFAAYFITYSIFKIAQKFFKKDYDLLLSH